MSKTIITIGRQYGSDGRSIGRMLAERLDIPYYDKEIFRRAAEQSGLYTGLFPVSDDRARMATLNMLALSDAMGINGESESAVGRLVIRSVFEVLHQLADEGSCVLVGHCADYALREREGLLSAFIYAPLEQRIQKVMQRSNIKTEREARRIVERADRQRANYYNYYTMNDWGRVDNYDLCINSALFGMEGTADILADIVRKKEQLG